MIAGMAWIGPGLARLRVLDATRWEPGRWDELAARSPRGEAFQSHAWMRSKEGLGWHPLRVVIQVGSEPVAVASIQERRVAPWLPGSPGRITYLYAPRGPVLLRDGAAAAGAALLGLSRVARARRAAVLTIDPAWEAGSPEAVVLLGSGFRPAEREIQVSRTAMLVPLEGSEAAQHGLLGDSTARNINKARRAGVTTERVDLGDPAVREGALAAFWAMFEATGRREGFIVRDRDYQIEQWRALGEAGLASLWFAWANGRRQNGVLLLHCGRRLVSHLAGSADDADLRGTRANHLLQWEILRWGAGQGFETYDLGGVDTRDAPGIPSGPSHPLWNLYEFKRGFGARAVIFSPAHEYAPRALLGAAWRVARRLA
jgi:lipid II:glycine glycyltransferase (peptidoglycan interpeptide bridge formation enzyme)